MSMLQRYLAKILVTRWALVTFGLGALVMMLDLMANGDKIIAGDGDDLDAILRYLYLRLPIIFTRIFPFSLLLAVLLTLIELTVRRELVAMMGAGLSQFNLLLALAPVALVLGGVEFFVGDWLSPRATAELRDWGVADYGRAKRKTEGRPIWLREGSRIVRIGAAPRLGLLSDITIFERDSSGNVASKLSARRAVHEDGHWRLEDVREFGIETLSTNRTQSMRWNVTFAPSLILALVASPRDLTLGELTRFAGRADIGAHPTYVYEVWRQRKFAQPAVIVVIFLLCIPLAQRFQRQDGAAMIVGVGVIGGFVFFAFDGLLVSMGETGILPPVMAAWAATGIFGLIGLTMAFRRELL